MLQGFLSLIFALMRFRKIGVRYLRIVGFAYPLQVYSVAASGLLRSTERVRLPLIASIISVLTNLFFNWVLIFGHLGAPKLGVEGAALATVIAAIVNVSIIVILSRSTGFSYLFMLKKHFAWDGESIRLFFEKSFPIICNELALFIFSYADEPIRFILMQVHMHSGGWIRPVTVQGKYCLPKFREEHPLKYFWTRLGIK